MVKVDKSVRRFVTKDLLDLAGDWKSDEGTNQGKSKVADKHSTIKGKNNFT